MYQKLIEEKDTIYELDDECVNKQKEERENRYYEPTPVRKDLKEVSKKYTSQYCFPIF